MSTFWGRPADERTPHVQDDWFFVSVSGAHEWSQDGVFVSCKSALSGGGRRDERTRHVEDERREKCVGVVTKGHALKNLIVAHAKT